ncbi:PAS domain-containing sensor histidine kinase [Beggiatoa leptomitoformis]|uniref:histidine kinase n=1 Tax=Beggiatoa leptomitoformis TaxID=288004 RepID=A0A2N9YIM7_9GAMM|nr:PAS domain-containing sensor histidine kinase [Beggiatoa leptomitoformis]AUI70350.1 PAS domain S-box protein [Beggiatoa leptomitoformis]QGX03610.1 PAS domain S-box protein [Beggiatoa leptomitoformis]
MVYSAFQFWLSTLPLGLLWLLMAGGIYWRFVDDSFLTWVFFITSGMGGLWLYYIRQKFLQPCILQQKNHQLINQLLDNMPHVFFQYQIDSKGFGKIRYINKQAINFYGLTSVKIPPAEILALIAEEDKERIQLLLDDIHNCSQNLNEVFRTGKEGSYNYLRLSATTYHDIDKNTIITGYIEDISEQKKLENALRKSKERFELAVLGSSSGLWDWGNTFEDRAWWSSRFFALLGYVENEVEPSLSRLTTFLHPDDRLPVMNALSKHLQERIPFDVDCRLQKKNEEYHWFRLLGQAVWDEMGKATRMAGSLNDITERKLAELALRKSAEQFRTLVENGSDWVWECDKHLIIKVISENIKTVLGYDATELIGHHLFTLIPQTELNDIQNAFNTDQNDRSPIQHQEIQLKRKDGVPLLVDITAIPLFDTDKRFLGYFGMGRDITLQHQNHQLSIENKELAKMTRLKDEFLATMSHELRTPLNAVLGMAEALQEGVYGHLDVRQLRSVQIIENSGKHLLMLINDILDLSKIEAGKMHLTLGDVALDSLSQQCIEFIRPQAAKKNLKLTIQTDTAITTIQADRQRLRQILINLLNNAVKFTPDNGEIGLELKNDPATKKIHITVWDKGIGIAEADKEKLFKPFSQIDARLSRHYEGTGLGLALIYRLTLLHGGQVSVESEIGKGSRFTISLNNE